MADEPMIEAPLMRALDKVMAGAVDTPSSIHEWLELGRQRGWILVEGCVAHDGLFTREELANEDDDMDLMDQCQPAVRLNFE